MHPLLVVAKHEYRSNVRRRGFLGATLFWPALGLLLLLFLYSQSDSMGEMLQGQLAATPLTELALEGAAAPSAQIGLVDQAGLLPVAASASLRLFPTESAARTTLARGELGSLFVIPREYLASGEVRVYLSGRVTRALLADAEVVRSALVTALAAQVEEVDPALVRRASDPMHLSTVRLDEDPAGRAAQLLAFLLAGFLVSTILTASQLFLVGVSEEKETRVIELLLSSMSPSDLLAGKVLGLGALGLTQVLIWLALGALPLLLLGAEARAALVGLVGPLRPLLLFLSMLYFLLGYLLYGSMATVLGAFGTRPAESQPLFMWLFVFLVAPFPIAAARLSESSAAAGSTDGGMPRLLSYFPLSSPTTMILRLATEEIPAAELLLSLLLLLLAIPLVVWVGGRLFQRTLLRYSKIPPWRRYVLLVIVGLLGPLSLLGVAYQRAGEARDLQRYPPPGRMVDMGGYRLHLHCLGEGSPTVLLEADNGANGLSLLYVQEQVIRHTRTCVYDRAGLGWSERGPNPRTAAAIAAELHALLSRGGEQGPYVLVGHGLGAVFVRLYADQYPEQVSGLVLVNPTHEAQARLMPEELRAAIEYNERERAAQLRLLATLMRLGVLRLIGERGEQPPLFTTYSLETQSMLYALFLRPLAIDTALEEMEGLAESMAALEQSTLPGDLPLRVITPGESRVPGLTAEQNELNHLTLLALHADLAARSTEGEHLIAEKRGTDIPREQPEIVLQAILEVVEASRQQAGGR